MGALTLTDVTAGNVVKASDVNNGWSAIKTVVNGNLDRSNIKTDLYKFAISRSSYDHAGIQSTIIHKLDLSHLDVVYITGGMLNDTQGDGVTMTVSLEKKSDGTLTSVGTVATVVGEQYAVSADFTSVQLYPSTHFLRLVFTKTGGGTFTALNEIYATIWCASILIQSSEL